MDESGAEQDAEARQLHQGVATLECSRVRFVFFSPGSARLRLNILGGLVTIIRKAMKDITLRDGTLIPRGTFLAAPTAAIHHDERKYAAPDVFDPFRFARMRDEDNDRATSLQFSNTSTDWLPFGHGRHAWCASHSISRWCSLTKGAL